MSEEILKFQEYYPISVKGMDGLYTPKKTIQLLPIGTIFLKDKMTGKVQQMDITPELCNQIVDNFRNNVRGQKIPITLEHDAVEAEGWIVDCYATDQGFFVIPDYGEDMLWKIRNGKLGYASIELTRNWLNPMDGITYDPVLIAVALTIQPVIKNITGIIEGFSENFATLDEITPNEEKKKSCSEDMPIENECKPLADIVNEIEQLKTHPEIFNKKGAPQTRALLKNALDNIKKYVKEDDTVDKSQTPENQETSVNLSEINKSWELKLSEVQRQAEEKIRLSEEAKAKAESSQKEAEEKLKLSEAGKEELNKRVETLEEKDSEKDDVILFSELQSKGQILPKDKEKFMADMKKARNRDKVLKFSEPSLATSYKDMIDDYKARPVVIKFGEVGFTPPDVDKQEDKGAQVLALSETLQKEKGMSKNAAIKEATKQLNYSYKNSK